MIRNQIMGNKGLQKYLLLGELSWASVFAALRIGKELSQFNNPSIQEALDTGKMTASYCCAIGNVCRKLLLRTCQSKNWELLAQLNSTHWGCLGESSELEGIKNALNDDWVVDALVVGKIKLEELCEFPIYEVRLNSDYERISRNEILDNFPILLFNEYSVLCFAPVQQAIDRGQLTLSDLLTLTFEELNSIVPDFYKGTFFERVFDIVVPDLNIQNNIKEDCSIQ